MLAGSGGDNPIAMAHTGTLKKFLRGKGYGFIENSDGSGQVFVHFDDMIVGVKLTFDIGVDPRSANKTRATNVAIDSCEAMLEFETVSGR